MKSYNFAACGAIVLHLATVIVIRGGEVAEPAVSTNQARQLARVDDLLVLQATTGDTLIAVDRAASALYSRSAPSQRRKNGQDIRHLPFDSFARYPVLPPTAFAAYDAGRWLYVDTPTKELRLQTFGRDLAKASGPAEAVTSISLSSAGAALATDSSVHAYLAELGEIPLTCEKCKTPKRVILSGTDLFVFDPGAKAVFQGDLTAPRIKLEVSQDLSQLSFAVSDVAVYRGVYYFVGLNKIAIRNRHGGEITTITLADQNHFTRVAAASNSLYIADDANHVVLSFARPAPVIMKFEGNAQENANAVVDIYSYLVSRGLLPKRQIVVDDDFANWRDFLTKRRLLPSSSIDLAQVSELEDVLTRLNSVPFYARPPIHLAEPIPKGTKLFVPSMDLAPYTTLDVIDLSGMSVADYLDAFANTPGGERLTSEYLANVNGLAAEKIAGVLRRNTGSLLLPTIHWRLIGLVSAEDIKLFQGELRTITSRYPHIKLLSSEEVGTTASSCVESTGIPSSDADSTLKAASEAQRRRVNFTDAPSSRKTLTIAIAEDKDSVDMAHPAFYDGSGPAWYAANPDSSFQLAPTTTTAEAESTPQLKNYEKSKDHGTHVAGVVAARTSSRTPGFDPAAHLFLVDLGSKSIGTVDGLVDDALNRTIRLFNFSTNLLPLPGDRTDDFKKLILGPKGQHSLFVVAVENSGKQLEPTSAPPEVPLRWALHASNVIGVGASNDCGDILGDLTDADGSLVTGSNYGIDYVHILAPGLGIYSCVHSGAYAPASGTSDASPQVVATAAVLMRSDVPEPSALKARLIYTGDWYSQHRGKVWGGVLNYGRAISHPHDILVWTQSAANIAQKLVPKLDTNPTIIITNSKDEAGLEDTTRSEIPLQNILRFHRMASGFYRVIYLDAKANFRVVYDADLSFTPKIPCVSLEAEDNTSHQFHQDDDADTMCKDGLQIVQIVNYVGATPATVGFQ